MPPWINHLHVTMFKCLWWNGKILHKLRLAHLDWKQICICSMKLLNQPKLHAHQHSKSQYLPAACLKKKKKASQTELEIKDKITYASCYNLERKQFSKLVPDWQCKNPFHFCCIKQAYQTFSFSFFFSSVTGLQI